MYVFTLTCVGSMLVSMHTYECNYACINVWVHAAGDWSVGNKGLDDGGMVMGSAVWGWTGGGWG